MDKIEPQSIPVGSLETATNFQTKGDKMELRRGSLALGAVVVGGRCNGVHVAKKYDGTDILFRKRGRKLEYYDTATELFVETGSDIFPAAAENDEASFVNYTSQAGAQLFINTQNTGMYKIMTANPGSYTDLQTTNYKGRIFGGQNRIFLVRRKGSTGNKDDTGIYLSYIDARAYTTITAEAIGASGSLTYTGTLAFKAAGAKRTCFGVTFTDGVETFSDNFDGTLTGSAGGTGTINYTTGAYSITFNAVAAGAVTSTYQHEDSTNTGVADFSFSSPTRVAGQGDVFRQDEGGGVAQSVMPFGDSHFCFHEKKTWDLTLGRDDTTATNLVFRALVGIPNWRAADAAGEGIYFLDDSTENDPVLRLLTLETGSTADVPINVSKNIKLEDYRFDKAWVKVWTDLILIGCRHKDSVENNTIFIYDKLWKSIDKVDYYSTNADIYNGTLVIGDNLSGTVYTAFSGSDDDGAIVTGEMVTNLWHLEFPERLKKVKRLEVEGEIGPNQIIFIYASPDRGAFVKIGEVLGTGSYVDKSQSVAVGAQTLGRGEIGGGSSGIEAYHYKTDMRMSIDKFDEVQIRAIVGVTDAGLEGIGYFSLSKLTFRDIRLKSEKMPSKYRT